MRPIRSGLLVVLLVVAGIAGYIQPVGAEPPANSDFLRTWQRTDWPVANSLVSRTWIWGPEAFTNTVTEPYAESPNGERLVQYFDKSRMEITFPDGDRSSPFYVTNGLLVVELISGRLQTGDNSFEDRSPAIVNVAGDATDPDGPTYASFSNLLDTPPLPFDRPIVQTISRDGAVGFDNALASEDVQIAILDDVTLHAIAEPFWAFMNASGPVVEAGEIENATLFENPYFATGRPITEAYWADVQVSGEERQVLIQCFERRCLTYTPGNDPGFITEAGNVGQHYYAWRYENASPQPTPEVALPTQAAWRQIEANGDSPLARRDHALIASGGVVYLSGGRDGNGTALDDFWSFDPTTETWTELNTSGGPSARFGHNAIFDARKNRVVLFGGQAGPVFFSDVWAWDIGGGGWTQIGTGGGPLARYGAAGTYDALTNSFIVSHGFTSSGRFDDTWRFDLTSDSWQEISPAVNAVRPEARCLHRGAADPHHGRILLFGGQSNTASYLGDLWIYNVVERRWEQQFTDGPSARNFYAAANGEESRYWLVHGGNAGGAATSDLWLFDYGSLEWRSIGATGDNAPALIGHDSVWIGEGRLMVVGSGQTWIATLS